MPSIFLYELNIRPGLFYGIYVQFLTGIRTCDTEALEMIIPRIVLSAPSQSLASIADDGLSCHVINTLLLLGRIRS